jgi:hypothetical protein
MGSGLFYGNHPHETSEIDPDIGVQALAAEIGHDAAQAAVSRKLSREAIEEAVADAHEKAGIVRKKAPTVRRIMGNIVKAEGLRKVTTTRCSSYRPRGEAAGAVIDVDSVDE